MANLVYDVVSSNRAPPVLACAGAPTARREPGDRAAFRLSEGKSELGGGLVGWV